MLFQECKEPSCREKPYRRGFCRKHYRTQPKGGACASCGTKIRSGFIHCIDCSKKAWKQNNPDKVRDDNSTRRAKARTTVTEQISRAVVWARDKGICGICKQKVSGTWHLDHVIPLARGGTHTYDNVQVTHPKCNMKKWAKIL